MTLTDICWLIIIQVDQLNAFNLLSTDGFANVTRWLKDLEANVKGYSANYANVVAMGQAKK